MKEDPGNYRSISLAWEGDVAANPGNQLQAHEGQEGDRE